MASTRKINDSCYFQMLCEQTKKPGLYSTNNNTSINNLKCYPNKNLNHPKMNYKLTGIENNLFNLTNKSSKCLDGNILDDKRINFKNELPDCQHNIYTSYIKMDINNINRGLDNFDKNFNLYHNPNGNYMNHINNGVISKCPIDNNKNCLRTDKINPCYCGSEIQSRIGLDTRNESRRLYEQKLNNNGNNNSDIYNNYQNNIDHETNYISDSNCNCNCDI